MGASLLNLDCSHLLWIHLGVDPLVLLDEVTMCGRHHAGTLAEHCAWLELAGLAHYERLVRQKRRVVLCLRLDLIILVLIRVALLACIEWVLLVVVLPA